MGILKLFKKKGKPQWAPAVFTVPRPPNAADLLGGTFDQRIDIVKLIKPGSVGVELGVAEGVFSDALLSSSENIAFLYSIDMWAGDRGHDVEEYRKALARLDKHRERNSVLKMRFDEALPLFPDAWFDFIYIDGYAHTGEEGGETLRDWWPKLKPGGLFSGDDYSPTYPLVMQEVDRFASLNNLEIMLIEPKALADKFSRSPSWLTFKP
jgi:hypothetical protein